MSGYYGSVMLEAVVVGAMLASLMAMAIVVYPLKDVPGKAAMLGFVLGAMTHILFEVSKANTWYCDNGAACAARRGR